MALDQHAMAEQLTSAESARAPRYPFGAQYTDPGHPDVDVTVDLTRVNMVHFEPAMRGPA